MTDQTTGRFATAEDTPCPFRLARFGYARTGEFRTPQPGEMYIQPTEGPTLQEHEPLILGACGPAIEGERHIVRAISPEVQEALAKFGPFAALFLSDEQLAEIVPEAA